MSSGLIEHRTKNFQVHRKKRIKFDDQITTITGPSDVGKSSLLRSLRWACLNQPQGIGFLNVDSDFVLSEVILDEHKIRRYRTSSENIYIVDGKERKSFGTNVPDDVSDIVRMSELNFQDQMDPPFWLSLSASELSRQLNDIVDLKIIDFSLSNISKTVRTLKSERSVSQSRLEKARRRKDDLKWILKADDQFEVVSNLWKELKTYRKKTSRLDESIEKSKRLHYQIQQQTKQHRDLGDLCELGDRINKQNKRIERLENLCLKIKTNSKVVQEDVPSSLAVDLIVGEWKTLNSKASDLSGVIDNLTSIERKLEKLKTNRSNLEKVIREETEGKCPVCGKDMDV